MTARDTNNVPIYMRTDTDGRLIASGAVALAQVAGSPFTLSSSWQKVVSTTLLTRALRLGVVPNPSAYDIEWVSVVAGAAAPTDLTGEGVLAGEDFASGLPIGDVYCKSVTGQKLIVKVA